MGAAGSWLLCIAPHGMLMALMCGQSLFPKGLEVVGPTGWVGGRLRTTLHRGNCSSLESYRLRSTPVIPGGAELLRLWHGLF